MRLARSMILLLVPLMLAGCANANLTSLPRLTGSQPVALPAGAASLRGSIASTQRIKLSSAAEERAILAEYQALQFGPVGQPVSWEADGFRGQFVPTQLYRVGSQDCRGFTHTITRGDNTVRQVGTACRQGEDQWTPVA
ncbi:hypothetical protein [Aureimonas sp. AU4]|uniref:hypothetical protein n=1 Tax=Aureimonas sp. AU4 TaxID=1638163 RepID=UPI0012E36CEF|nr:hypothetical protein [Aureimonas sp. AU4]